MPMESQKKSCSSWSTKLFGNFTAKQCFSISPKQQKEKQSCKKKKSLRKPWDPKSQKCHCSSKLKALAHPIWSGHMSLIAHKGCSFGVVWCVPIYFSCRGECCTVLLWSFKNGLWTPKLQQRCEGEWMMNEFSVFGELFLQVSKKSKAISLKIVQLQLGDKRGVIQSHERWLPEWWFPCVLEFRKT